MKMRCFLSVEPRKSEEDGRRSSAPCPRNRGQVISGVIFHLLGFDHRFIVSTILFLVTRSSEGFGISPSLATLHVDKPRYVHV